MLDLSRQPEQTGTLHNQRAGQQREQKSKFSSDACATSTSFWAPPPMGMTAWRLLRDFGQAEKEPDSADSGQLQPGHDLFSRQ